MKSILSTILTLFFAMPFLGFFLVFIVVKGLTKNSRKAMHTALDYSTILFIGSVYFLIDTIWGKSLFGIIILVLIIIAIFFVFAHWKLKGEIMLIKVWKGFWRFTFLLFFLAYITLTLYGLIVRALTFTFF